MEYLKSFDDPSKLYDENHFDFVDITNDERYVQGNLKGFNDNCCSGKRLSFITSSKKILLKVELENVSSLNILPDWNTKGFDVYEVSSGNYRHKTIFAPFGDNNIFLEEINNVPNSILTIFLPNFSNIKNIYLGIEKNHSLQQFKSPVDNESSLIFIGDKVVQGAVATRNGNSFPNIISRITNKNIINIILEDDLNILIETLDKLEKYDFSNYVIHFSKKLIQNCTITEIKNFYDKLINVKSGKKIILLIDDNISEFNIDEYKRILQSNKNIILLYLEYLFNQEDLDLVINNDNYFSDYAMYVIAKNISEFFK